MPGPSEELSGLTARLDNLEYHFGGENAPEETPHVFIYHITIENRSDRAVKLLGRKWIIVESDGETLVVEGDKIVGEEPDLEPGEKFTYNSFHLAGKSARARGSFHGIDRQKRRIHTLLPEFELAIPRNEIGS